MFYKLLLFVVVNLLTIHSHTHTHIKCGPSVWVMDGIITLKRSTSQSFKSVTRLWTKFVAWRLNSEWRVHVRRAITSLSATVYARTVEPRWYPTNGGTVARLVRRFSRRRHCFQNEASWSRDRSVLRGRARDINRLRGGDGEWWPLGFRARCTTARLECTRARRRRSIITKSRGHELVEI